MKDVVYKCRLVPSAISLWCGFPHAAMRALLLAIALRSPSLLAEHAGFYRINSSSNQSLLSFSTDGTLSWSGALGGFSVEKRTNSVEGTWAPWARGTSVTAAASLKVHDFTPPPEMVFIPAGYFMMGDAFNDTQTVALPVHPVFVSGFYIDKFEVTYEKIRRALQWAYDAGKLTVTATNIANAEGDPQILMWLPAPGQQVLAWNGVLNFNNGQFLYKNGSSYRTNHPAVWVTWYGAVAYCNYLSQMEGLPVCYNLTNWTCDFNATGYRLPTEAEWEKAARGGREGYRFPWANEENTTTHARANYRSNTNFTYDVSPTPGFNPIATNQPQPYTTAVGYFPPNGYGLYDVSGNVWEYVWDWGTVRYQGVDPKVPQFDPTGMPTGQNRAFRGGSWYTVVNSTIVASRYVGYPPTTAHDDIGFRTARKAPQ